MTRYVNVLFCSTRRDLQRTASSGSLSYPESPEFTMRPRTLSNASSCGGGGRMSPMPLLASRGGGSGGPGLQQATVAATAQTHSSTSQSNASSTATLAEAAAAPSALDRWVLWPQLWNFLGRRVKFNAFLHPNEHSERICFYLVRQFEAELSKIGHNITKQSFSRMVRKIMLLMKVVLLIWYSNKNFYFRKIESYLASKID